ncbi:acyl-CoA N-acyltransferase [Phycomyces nitens]|nr:acyl-CoA N-acyltransferase [Phycomyces nitens]
MLFTVQLIGPFDSKDLYEITQLVKQLSPSASGENVTRSLESTLNRIVIARDSHDNTIIGIATLVTTHCMTGLRAHVEDVVVDEAWRGKGVGKALLSKVIEISQSLHTKTLDLTSRPEREAANGLYRKLGFVQRETNVYRYSP